MRRLARRARGVSRGGRLLIILAIVVAYGTVLLIPANAGDAATHLPLNAGDAALTHRPAGLASVQLPPVSDNSQTFGGVAPVGALFTVTGGELDSHFCTASVVHSSHGDLAVTAAHCLAGIQGPVAFVPGYANGKEPYGTWQVTAVYTDQAWQSSQDPDDDVAFLRLSEASGGVPVEDVTGAERLGTGWQVPALAAVIGYPGSADQPVLCRNWAKSFSPTQLEFDCGGYTDGTSGGPFLVNMSASSGQGTVIGVIGGYEQGGDTPDVSYASAFGTAVAALYRSAEAGG